MHSRYAMISHLLANQLPSPPRVILDVGCLNFHLWRNIYLLGFCPQVYVCIDPQIEPYSFQVPCNGSTVSVVMIPLSFKVFLRLHHHDINSRSSPRDLLNTDAKNGGRGGGMNEWLSAIDCVVCIGCDGALLPGETFFKLFNHFTRTSHSATTDTANEGGSRSGGSSSTRSSSSHARSTRRVTLYLEFAVEDDHNKIFAAVEDSLNELLESGTLRQVENIKIEFDESVPYFRRRIRVLEYRPFVSGLSERMSVMEYKSFLSGLSEEILHTQFVNQFLDRGT